jgi:hypothetical protein
LFKKLPPGALAQLGFEKSVFIRRRRRLDQFRVAGKLHGKSLV